MRKIIISAVIVILIAIILAGCSEKVGRVDPKEEKLHASQPVAPEDLLSENDFVGIYKNGDYTIEVKQGGDELFYFTVTSAAKDGQSSEWKMNGYFSSETYRVNYTGAVKTVIYYNKSGTEKSRETAYTDGAGRMQFGDDGSLVWNNSMETLEGSNTLKKAG